MRDDLRYAVRALTRSRMFALAAIATLALGIGADTAAFSLVDALLFRPLPYAQADQLVDVHEWSATKLCAGCGVGVSLETLRDVERGVTAFSSLGSYEEAPMALNTGAGADRVSGSYTTASLFVTLGARAWLGRTLMADDERAGAAPVVVLSHSLWARRFAADSGAIGRVVRVNGVARTVVGVMPDDFHFPEFATLWTPFEASTGAPDREARTIGVVARLRDGMTLDRANAQLNTIGTSVARANPATNAEWTVRASSLREEIAGTEAQLFLVLLGAVSLVLLIVCANLAGLLLARGVSRSREIAVRLALGASRGRVVRALLVESGVLALVGGALGVLIAWWTVDAVAARFAGFIPFWIDFRVDARVLLFALAMTAVSVLAFGLVPALRASSPNVQRELREGGHNTSAGRARARLRSVLVAGELATALVLLAAAGTLVKSFLRISARADSVDLGRLLSGQLEFVDARYSDSTRIAAAAEALSRQLAGVPGVAAAAVVHDEFIAGFGGGDRKILAEGVPDIADGVSPRFAHAVSPDYFAIQEIGLVRGRFLTSGDRAGAAPVAVVNDRLARALFGGDALGKRIKLHDSAAEPWLTIVGISRDLPGAGGRPARNEVYTPFAQRPNRPVTITLRASVDEPMSVAPAVRRAVASVDPDLPLVDLMSAEAARARNYAPYKLYASVMSAFAALAVLLAALGVYGIVAFGVQQRRREIAIRVALGANRANVLRLVTSEGVRLALIGTALGLALSAAALQVLRSMLFGASPVDPLVMVVVSALLGLLVLVASYVPAVRATRVDPVIALRYE